ncbi:MAG: radical SAM protein [Candidatus Thorarchaeota archaeon]|nr:radical SAM protein [Candidatus Thorarchaeota archaeon]
MLVTVTHDEIRRRIGERNRNPQQRPYAAIMKSADTCNNSCTYCYVEPHSTVPIMTKETAEIAIRTILEYVGPNRQVNFIWHGGEPLLAGLPFFKHIADVCDEYVENRIENSIQTNGTLLNEEFLELCVNRHILISLSIDGPKDIHDLMRKDKGGRGTFYQVMDAVAMIRNVGLPVGCVTVLHQQNLHHIERMYKFFRDNDINFRINPIVKSGRATRAYNELSITPKEYGEAMCKLFDLWFEEDGPIQIEPLETIVGNLIGPTVWGCDYHGTCLLSIISVNPDGGLYPCGRFAGLENFKLGDININSDFEAMFESSLFKRLSSRSPLTVSGCSDCEFVEICNTGCMVTAFMGRNRIEDPDYYCYGRRMLFSHIFNALIGHLRDVQ